MEKRLPERVKEARINTHHASYHELIKTRALLEEWLQSVDHELYVRDMDDIEACYPERY